MNPEIKAKWVAALRSGEYRQAQRKLRGNASDFCCLGVLCDLVNPSGWMAYDAGQGATPFRFKHRDGDTDYAISMPPSDVLRAVELDRGIAANLAERNDDGELFADLAEFIEANL